MKKSQNVDWRWPFLLTIVFYVICIIIVNLIGVSHREPQQKNKTEMQKDSTENKFHEDLLY